MRPNIRFKYNNSLRTLAKTHLPIIGNNVPNKNFAWFSDDETNGVISAGTGDGSQSFNYLKAYGGYGGHRSCLKITHTSSSKTRIVTYTPTSVIDMTSLTASDNNNASVIQTGTRGADEDRLVLVVQWQTGTNNLAPSSFKIWNGTQYASLKTTKMFTYATVAANAGRWVKSCIPMNSTYFDYNAGFVAASWAAVSKVEIAVSSPVAGGGDFYLGGMWVALPKYTAELLSAADPTFSSAYHPVYTDATSIYVSHAFGEEVNNGQTRQQAVRSLQRAKDLAVTTRVNIVILDSEVYKPAAIVSVSEGYAGLTSFATNVNLIADYLETPTISAEAGAVAETYGARNYRRTRTQTTGTKRTVGVGGTYATITLAVAAASSGDVIEFVDSATYDEAISYAATTQLTFQAAQLCLPIWKKTGGTPLTISGGAVAICYGITFSGVGAASEILIIADSSATLTLDDCTFTGVGAGGICIRYTVILATIVSRITGCMFIDNNVSCVKLYFNVCSLTCVIVNCEDYATSAATDAFVATRQAHSSNPLSIYILGCSSTPNSSASLGKFIDMSSGTATATRVYVYAFLNSVASLTHCDGTNNILFTLLMIANRFHDNDSATAAIMCRVTNPGSTTVTKFNTNRFDKINFAGGYCIATTSTGGTHEYKFNIFTNCRATTTCIAHGGTGSLIDSNMFYNCYYAIWANSALTFSLQTFVDCTASIYIPTGSVLNVVITKSLFENSPPIIGASRTLNGTATPANIYTTALLCQNVTGLFNNPSLYDFSWGATSMFESAIFDYTTWVQPFIYINQAVVTLKFLNLKAGYGWEMVRKLTTSLTTIQYCNIDGGCTFGISERTATGFTAPFVGLKILNNRIQNCGDAIRLASIKLNFTAEITNNILDENHVGILLKSGANIQYNTVVNNSHGIQNAFSGYYAIDSYITQYMTIKNNIIFGSYVVDYDYDKSVQYCIIGTTVYPGAVSEITNKRINPVLDANFYPATVYTGEEFNSAAYLAASDATKNIGARNLNLFASTLVSTDATLTDNPAVSPSEIKSINQTGAYSVDGTYKSTQDAYARIKIFTWTADTTCDEDQRDIVEDVYMSEWVVGVSEDDGVTYQYYAVVKDSGITSAQEIYMHDALPHGNQELVLAVLPYFVLADYITDTLGAL